ncbi:hypothetical protein [Maioricimonas sp. JC845]|uniref:hypothetical protein n=1 Tax=Maioricimonas sp. JC845 TaxID=3232138 RepID=UPI003459AA95
MQVFCLCAAAACGCSRVVCATFLSTVSSGGAIARGIGLVLSLLAVAVFSPGAAMADDELPTPEEIRDHLYEWRKDFVVFRVGYDIASPGSSIRMHREFLLTDTRDYLDIVEWHGRSERPYREVAGGNAAMRFNARYVQDESGKTWSLSSLGTSERTASNVGAGLILQVFWPLVDVYSGRWLDETLLDHDVTVRDGGVIDGEECVLVEVVYRNEDKFSGDRFWLAKNRDWLPRRTEPMDGSLVRNAHYFCDEYRRHAGRWYPARGRLGQEPDVQHWEVTRFEVNPELTGNEFVPPDDTELRKEIAARSREQAATRRPVPAAEREPVPVAQPYSVDVKTISIGLLVLGGIVLIAAWWSRRTA